MQITGSRPKVDAIDFGTPGEPAGNGRATDRDPVESYFDNAFGNGLSNPSPSSTVGNANPIDDYTFGDIRNGQAAVDEGADISGWLTNFPPSLEEIVTGNESATSYLDLVMRRYEQARSDLRTLRDTYRQALASGTLSISEAESLSSRMGLIETALARCDSEMQKVTQQSGRQEILYIDELQSMQDLDNNGWVGRPRANGSYYVRHNTDGTTTYFDPRTRRAIPNPLMDPEYEPRVTNDNSLEVLEENEAHRIEGVGPVDLHLRLTWEAIDNASSNRFDTPIDIGIPEYLWVEKRGEGNGEEPYRLRYDTQTSTNRMAIYDRWSTEGGLHQEIPSDISRYMQIQITDAVISSEDNGLRDENGNVLYDHFIEFKNGEETIARIQIEGNNHPDANASSRIGDGRLHLAASSVGFSIHGSNRATPIKIDASDFRSTGHHQVDDLPGALGVSPPNASEGQDAFWENIRKFDDTSFRRHENPAITSASQIRDEFQPELDETGGPNENLTGIFVYDLRGDIRGTNYSDIIVTTGANELSPYARDHLPENRREITKGDPFYSNRVEAQGGNNIVVAGSGDNYIYDASFAWVEANGADEHFISTPRVGHRNSGTTRDSITFNPTAFVHIDGGRANIVNPDETDVRGMDDAGERASEAMAQLQQDRDSPNQTDALINQLDDLEVFDARYYLVQNSNGTWKVKPEFSQENNSGPLQDALADAIAEMVGREENNDYFETVRGSASYMDPDDEDIVGARRLSGLDETGIVTAGNEKMQEWYEELTRVPEADETGPQISWDDVMGASTELDSEMNGFFDEMFGGMNDLFGDFDLDGAFGSNRSSTPDSEGTL